MSGLTHAVIGANAIWIASVYGVVDQNTALLAGVGAIAGLLPDIDASSAKIHYLFGQFLSVFKGRHSGIFEHRGIFHSILSVIIIFVFSFIFLRQYNLLLPLVITIGYASHILIDGLNTGVGYFFPFNRQRYALVPKFLRSKVKGPVDQALFILGTVSLLFFFLINIKAIADTVVF